jgi:hypothetical protein
MAYVEREQVLELIANIMQDCKVKHKHRALNRNIKQIPTADVVEVVRCENCTRRVDYEGRIMCNKFGHKFHGEWYGLRATTKDHFCSDGERRDI